MLNIHDTPHERWPDPHTALGSGGIRAQVCSQGRDAEAQPPSALSQRKKDDRADGHTRYSGQTLGRRLVPPPLRRVPILKALSWGLRRGQGSPGLAPLASPATEASTTLLSTALAPTALASNLGRNRHLGDLDTRCRSQKIPRTGYFQISSAGHRDCLDHTAVPLQHN